MCEQKNRIEDVSGGQYVDETLCQTGNLAYPGTPLRHAAAQDRTMHLQPYFSSVYPSLPGTSSNYPSRPRRYHLHVSAVPNESLASLRYTIFGHVDGFSVSIFVAQFPELSDHESVGLAPASTLALTLTVWRIREHFHQDDTRSHQFYKVQIGMTRLFRASLSLRLPAVGEPLARRSTDDHIHIPAELCELVRFLCQ